MKNRVLVYDDNCPLCSWYSSLFVTCGLLPATGRQAFSSIDPDLLKQIDFNRSRNEIPLMDIQSGQTWYGIDALLEILGQKIPLIKKTGRVPPVYWFLQKLYKFISFNRKVIVAQKCGPGSIDCTPDINYTYRALFMLFSLVITTVLLAQMHTNVLSFLDAYALDAYELQTAHFGLVGVNVFLSLHLKGPKAFEYMGQVSMLALLAMLVLTPLLIARSMTGLPDWTVYAWFAGTTVLIFREYLRRMQFAGVLLSHHWIGGINLACMAGFVIYLFF